MALGTVNSAPHEVEEEFAIAGCAGDGRRRHRHAAEAHRLGVGRDAGDDRLVHGRIGDEAALADFVAAGLELRLDERDDIRVRSETAGAPERCGAAR